MAIKGLRFIDEEENLVPDKGNMKKRIKELNSIYKEHDMPFYIDKDLYSLELIKDQAGEYKPISNFFFFPTHEIHEFDGNKEKPIGFTICFVQKKGLISSNVINKKSVDFTNKTLEKETWYDEKKLRGFEFFSEKIDLKKLMKVTLKSRKVIRKVNNSSIGWVKGKSTYHYVPITNFQEDDIIFDKKIRQNYKLKVSEDLSEIDAYIKMYDLLGIIESDITIPLLSLTVLSSVMTLIKKNNKNYPKLIICLYGDDGHNKEALSNLFCNIYNRSIHIYKLDGKLHGYQSLNKDISKKAAKLRDAVFISVIEKRGDLEKYTKLLKQNNGILIIAKTQMEHHSVIDININKATIDQKILLLHKNNPVLFTTWFDFFIKHIHNTLDDKDSGLGIKGYMDSLYKKSIKKITKKQFEYDPNKLEHYGWILSSLTIFLNYGLKINAITKYQYEDSINQAIAISSKHCTIKLELENETEVNKLKNVNTLEKDAITFLHTINNLIDKGGLNKIGDCVKRPTYGWIDVENDLLYLHNKETYSEVNNYLKTNGEIIKTKRLRIYEFLYTPEVKVIPIKNPDDDSWGVDVPSSNARGVCYSIPKMKQFLLNSGYELFYLKDK